MGYYRIKGNYYGLWIYGRDLDDVVEKYLNSTSSNWYRYKCISSFIDDNGIINYEAVRTNVNDNISQLVNLKTYAYWESITEEQYCESLLE